MIYGGNPRPVPDIVAHWKRRTSLLAIDPGARTGWAFYLDVGGWFLQACGVAQPDEDFCPFAQVKDVVIENPQIYPQSRARPNDILTLARIVGRYEERFRAARVRLVKPREWKGSINGDVFCARIEASLPERDRPALSAYRGGYRHNCVDAVGLGAWALRQPWFTKTPASDG
jgi:hypothetical protein